MPGDAQTIESFSEGWLARQEKYLKASTYNGYRKIVVHQLIPWFSDKVLSDLKCKDIREKLDTLGASNKRLANIQSVLRKALDDAIDDELIEINPLAVWRYARKEAPKSEDDVDPFSADEQRSILAGASGQAKNLLQFAFWTGMRTSELVALQWGDIDWNRGEVRISRALTQAVDTAEVTKTAAGKHDVKLLRHARKALEAQKEFTFLAGKDIFHNPRTGKPWEGNQAIRRTLWTHVLKKAGVRYRRPYQTRHTYASMMLSAGEHPMWVARQMGHADWTMITRVYGRWMPDADSDAGSKAEKLFGRNDSISPTSVPKAA